MSPTDFPTFGTEHIVYMGVCLAIWLALPFIGKNYLSPSQRIGVALFLAVFTIFQEVLFDAFQIYIDDYEFTTSGDSGLIQLGTNDINAAAAWSTGSLPTSTDRLFIFDKTGSFINSSSESKTYDYVYIDEDSKLLKKHDIQSLLSQIEQIISKVKVN